MNERAYRKSIRGRRAEHLPDAGFARRVVAALPAHREEELAFVARRLLPAATALAVVLLIWAGIVGPTEPVEQSEDLLTLLLQEEVQP